MKNEESNQIFVKIEEYKDILDITNVIKKKLVEANDTLKTVHDLKDKEDSELENWKQLLEDVGRKVNGIDKMIFEPGV